MNTLLFSILLLSPFGAAALCAISGNQKILRGVTTAATSMTFLAALILAREVLKRTVVTSPNSFFYADALSALLIVIVSGSTLAVSLYSTGYLSVMASAGKVSPGQFRLYYTLLNVFHFTMILVLLSNNLGFLWIGSEATTLATAFLVAFYDTERSLEAAWKYVIICSVGIALALFGVMLTYFSSIAVVGTSSTPLNWSTLMSAAKRLDPSILRLAYVFVLIGFGTKAGIAPMHTWKPDAYGESPAPISALMAGGLVNVALYSLMRFTILINRAIGSDFAPGLLLVFGLGSMIIATPFFLLQRDVKRLLSYSSVEHVGIIVFALGLATPLAYLGAVLHMLNNSIAKLLLFFCAGNLRLSYNSKIIRRITGAVRIMPLTATAFLIAVFAITGWPPFGVFVSELTIVSAGFASGNTWTSILFLGIVATIFIGFIFYASRMVFGDSSARITEANGGNPTKILFVVLILILIVLGAFIPEPVLALLRNAATVLAG